MLRPLQQHPHFAACLLAAGREMLETDHGSMILRRFGPVKVGLVSRGSAAMLDAPAPARSTVLFNADHDIEIDLRQRGFMRLRAPLEVAEWDISRPVQELRRSMRKTWRHGLDAAQSSGLKLSICAMPPVGDHWLLMAEQQQARARRYRALPLWITRAWATLHPKDATLIEARHRGEIVAGMVFLRHGDCVTYHIAHATETGKALGAHRLMLWRAAQHFGERGVKRIDLGQIDQAHAAGLARFKLGSGAQARRLGGSWISLPGVAQLRRRVACAAPATDSP